jgi:hypothetical protein
LTIKSCGYVSRYSLKKIGDTSFFMRNSRGMGYSYFLRHKKSIIYNNKIMFFIDSKKRFYSVPKFFYDKYKKTLSGLELIKFDQLRESFGLFKLNNDIFE